METRPDIDNDSKLPGRVLVIGAHPDDAVLGCGGAIARYVGENREVFYCCATRVYTPDWTPEYVENQMKELEASNRVLGINKTIYLDFPAVKLDTVPQKKLNDTIYQVVREVSPEIVYVHDGNDLNMDHRLLYESTLIATRPVDSGIERVLSYCTNEFGQIRAPFVPNVYIDISATIETKVRAMECFASEMRPFPHPRSPEIIRAMAMKRGSETGVPYAEAFRLVRELI